MDSGQLESTLVNVAMSNLLENSLYYLSNKGFDEVEVLTVIFCKFTLNLVDWAISKNKKSSNIVFSLSNSI